jgi:hypothetical protein
MSLVEQTCGGLSDIDVLKAPEHKPVELLLSASIAHRQCQSSRSLNLNTTNPL